MSRPGAGFASVHRFFRANLWHVRGRDLDLLIDTGMGLASLRAALGPSTGRPLLAVATHVHCDHAGGLHEFPERAIHEAEAAALAAPRDADTAAHLFRAEPQAVGATPHAGFDASAYAVRPAPATRLLRDGDRIDLGDRVFTVLHLPGHSPGSIALLDERAGVLFSGDVVYDGLLVDDLPHASPADYRRSMARLRDLPVRVVHAGHRASFGRARLVQLVDRYLG